MEQDPAGGDELVAADRAVAAVGVGEGGGGDQQAAGARAGLALLEQEFGFALFELVVEVQRPQQMPVQRVGAGIAWIQLAMPVGIAALIGGVPLQVDRARAQAGAGQVAQRLVAHLRDVLGHQPVRAAVGSGDLQHQR
ncbi:hypothetical protein XPU_3710 [Xanthomonas arboricola pv. pruni str. MAFF 311562]|uniref:Uncharacterized protein n=1 Tax=Xanthomonas arboricola pv. pruni str. MAFF 311562 TaxID=1414836 RepID=W4S7M1_9XANT|nr:hypothetical protein XPU_3710 [Xanthomonas arboricola pv. pruni str. MAFF 311562]